MKYTGLYMAQKQGLFGLEIAFSDTIRGAMKKAKITKGNSDFGLFTVKNGKIFRIKANGRIF